MVIGILASAALCGLYARGDAAWMLGFVALVPWRYTLSSHQTLRGALLSGYLMSLAFTAAVFAWFGVAIGSYTEVGSATGLVLLLIGAPLFQPQFMAYTWVRHLAGQRHGPTLTALAGAAAWVATERLVPRLLGDSLGHGLYPSEWMRQAADVGGVAGLTLVMVLTNECLADAVTRRAMGVRAMVKPLALAACLPAILAGYGYLTLSAMPPAPSDKPLRLGLIQSNLFDYEHQRQEKGTYAVVRDILDTHFAMSYDAVVRQHADAVLWSETAYPTTFGHPKSEAGAELDQQILGIVNSAGVPFVIGTYDRDATGEYNATAFVEPRNGILGFYRKTRLFPLTEYVPAWMDGPTFRRWVPWAGTWQPGNGARVFPLRLADGREIPVLPLICLDDVDTSLAIEGTRLGAQVILTMSNDSWFSAHPQGARLHQAVAAFRSIETRLPQFRVTTNGYSAVMDATGKVTAGSRLGERTLVMGDVPVHMPAHTIMVRWGNWVGLAGAALLACLVVAAILPKWRLPAMANASDADLAQAFPVQVTVLPQAARIAAGLLRAFARSNLIWLGAAMLLNDALRGNTLAQIRAFTGFFLVPEAAAWCVLLAFSARATLEGGALVLTSGARRLALPLDEIASVETWRLPLPSLGVSLRLKSGQLWRYGLALAHPNIFAKAMSAAAGNGVTTALTTTESLPERYAIARQAIQTGRLNTPWAKFVLLPVVLALPAFHLHQNIAYGGMFGEYYTFGLKAYLTTFALWWAAWAIGVVLTAAALRALIEAGTLIAATSRAERAFQTRVWLERLGLVMLYIGMPTWLLVRALGN